MRKIYLLGVIASALILSNISTESFAQAKWVRVKKNKVYSPGDRDMASIPSGQTFVGVPVDIMDTLRLPEEWFQSVLSLWTAPRFLTASIGNLLIG